MMKSLNKLAEATKLTKLRGMTGEKVKNAFFANYLAALVIQKEQDLNGLDILNDAAHHDMSTFSDKMNDVNFWGKVLFNPDINVKTIVTDYGRLDEQTRKINRKDLLLDMMANPTKPVTLIDWNTTIASLMLLRELYDVANPFWIRVVVGLYEWDELTAERKHKVTLYARKYLEKADPRSDLLPSLKALTSVTEKHVDARVIGFKRLTEEDGGGEGGADTGAANIASNPMGGNAIVKPASCSPGLSGLYKLTQLAPRQVTKKSKLQFRNGRIVTKVRKKFKPRKFKAPDFLRVKKETD